VQRRGTFSDAEILSALRVAADRCGQPLSHTRYDAVAGSVGGPSSARIIQRFGSWSRACHEAGVSSVAASREYQKRWDAPSVTAAVMQYLESGEGPDTFAGYTAWARGNADRPSGATVRNVMGGWAAAKREATRGTDD
jgi:hypothetical protein